MAHIAQIDMMSCTERRREHATLFHLISADTTGGTSSLER